MTTDTERDPLDGLLHASAPAVQEPSAALRAEARSMIAAARHGDGRQTRRRRLSRTAVAGIAVGSLLSVGGLSAAAATIDRWSWWAQEPDAAVTFTLPSGAECEYRIGGASDLTPQTAQAVRKWASSVDVSTDIDIDRAIERLRAQDFIEVQDDGTEIVGGYGTDHYYTPDREYHVAVTQALGDAISDEMNRQGLQDYANYMGETICADHEW
jgi:hypothetical protein